MSVLAQSILESRTSTVGRESPLDRAVLDDRHRSYLAAGSVACKEVSISAGVRYSLVRVP